MCGSLPIPKRGPPYCLPTANALLYPPCATVLLSALISSLHTPGDASVDPPLVADGVTVWGTRYFSAWYWINATNLWVSSVFAREMTYTLYW